MKSNKICSKLRKRGKFCGRKFAIAEWKWANPHFAWVSPLVNIKKRLFSNKHKEVIANNGKNKGASEIKFCSYVGKTLFLTPMLLSDQSEFIIFSLIICL